MALVVAALLAPFVSRRWPQLFFVVFVPLAVLVATTVASLTSGTARWTTGPIVYIAVVVGACSLFFFRGGPDLPISLIYAMVIGAVPAVAGVLAGWSIQLVRQRPSSNLKPLAALCLIPSFVVIAMLFRAGLDERRVKDSVLEQKLLSELPLGSSITQVTELIRSRGWELRRVNSQHGYHHQGVRPSRTEGAQHVEAYAGSYCNLLCTDVVIYWGFDSNGKLTSIWVWKTTNGP